jgi:hypothetical protein
MFPPGFRIARGSVARGDSSFVAMGIFGIQLFFWNSVFVGLKFEVSEWELMSWNS